MNTTLLISLFIIHLFLNQINLILGNSYYSFFFLIGRIINAIILHIERFHETIKYEALNHIPFLFKSKLRKAITEFIFYYNKFRSHRYHKGLTPDMVYYGIKLLKSPNTTELKIRSRTFCDGLITAYFLEQAA